jgi:hypothetical protein
MLMPKAYAVPGVNTARSSKNWPAWSYVHLENDALRAEVGDIAPCAKTVALTARDRFLAHLGQSAPTTSAEHGPRVFGLVAREPL